MSNPVIHQARSRGPIHFEFGSVAADLYVQVSDDIQQASAKLTALDGDENAIKAIEQARWSERGNSIELSLREGNIAGGTVIQSSGDIQIGFGSTVVNSFRGRSFSGNVVQIGNVSMGRIEVEVSLPVGSTVDANSTSGDITIKGADSVQAQTVSGDVRATGLTADSNLRTVSGDVRAEAASGRPTVRAKSVSGDIIGRGVVLRASTVSGDVTML